jgi:hypothetical protein
MQFAHPVVGELTLAYEAMAVPDRPDQVMVVYTAEPGSPSDDALRLLSSWCADSPSTVLAPPST